MPEIYSVIENSSRNWNNPVQVRHADGLSGFWTQTWNLPGNQYDGSEYVHQWRFYAYSHTNNWNGSSYPNLYTHYGAATAGGTTYLHDDQVIDLGQQVTLFMWNGEKWTYYFLLHGIRGAYYYVTYNGNGADGGSTDQSTAEWAANFWFRGNNFTRTGYYFYRWHVYDSGGWVGEYASGGHFGVWNRKSNHTAYAIWYQNTYTVSYNANNTDVGNGGATNNNTATYDNNFWLQGNGFTRTGYSFRAWHLYDGGTYIGEYASGGYFGVWRRTSNHTAYAQWNIIPYTVTFNSNGNGTGKTVTQNYKTTVTCPTLKAVGYVFGGWATSAASTTQNKAANATFTLGAGNENYFAIWTVNTNNVVRFSELQTVYGGTNPISISEYRTQSGQTTANSKITLSANFKGKGPAPP